MGLKAKIIRPSSAGVIDTQMFLPLLVVDSGSGGFSILQAICARMPHLSYSYAADYDACPYGKHSTDYIVGRMLSLVQMAENQRHHGAIVIACNTASTLILDQLRQKFSKPVIGVVPAVKPAFERYPRGKILLLATPQTVEGKYLENLVSQHAHGTELERFGTTELVSLSESVVRGRNSIKEIETILEPLSDSNFDAVVLGCTHFSLLRQELQQFFRDAELIDSAESVAFRVQSVAKGLLDYSSNREFYFTSNHLPPQAFIEPFGFQRKILIRF